MLTDRQQKFYDRFSDLLLLSSSADFIEKEWISDAKNAINRGENFNKVITVMMQKMTNADDSELSDLTPNVKKLLDDLIESYGTPPPLKENWKNNDPDYIYVPGSGRYGGGWRLRENVVSRKHSIEHKEQGRDGSGILIMKICLGVLLFSAILFFYILKVFPYISNKYGPIGIILSLILIMILLSYFGNLKRKKKS
ncbi:MAG: hypothetical protein FWE43_01085 [Streptococcaceae bacterium]|nr:hypothetical protein [Streptococcaceae bacterium]MCL2681071.1 hypothetical protein [Streptococcaceae bacterium]